MRRAGARAPDEGTEQHLAVRVGLAMGPPATQEEGASGCLEQRGCAGGWRHLGEEPQTKSAERTLAARPECHPALSPGELARAPGREGGHGCRQQLPSRRTAPVQPGRRV
ncbi:putative uncharacterized protein BRD3OS isoform X1 [Rousettus aegyptiacus]|uniref:putative uncharacterized protein BRD3OS isoform X1 n=1 Tax=Rousettus aegyptiacus TaxID=9407 RepID=UPI00168D6C3D|nr:putative uncharacterized protein BRD3OS isoform X1 [Rousettus aegyptiacus]